MEITDSEMKEAHLIYKVWDNEQEKFVGKSTYARSKKLGQVYSSKYHAENRANKMNDIETYNSAIRCTRYSVVSCVIVPMHERTFKMKKADVI